ncbi:MAG: hypothetical protein ACOCG4_02450 [Methanoculleus sp.]|jgi:hypothetical protein|nr:hypothetical protein [Methanomicrobiales archaeon]
MTTPIRRGLARRFGELTGEGARGMRPLRDGTLEQGSSHKKILGAIDKVGMLS